MVKDTYYYEVLQVETTATPDQIKRQYRRLAVRTHPDKNPNDPDAADKFKEVSEAYQVLSDPELRKKYDEFGKEAATNSEGFEDPIAFATNIFGGGAFESFIGEIAFMKEMTQLSKLEEEEEQQQQQEKEAAAGGATAEGGMASSSTHSEASSPRPASQNQFAALESGRQSPEPHTSPRPGSPPPHQRHGPFHRRSASGAHAASAAAAGTVSHHASATEQRLAERQAERQARLAAKQRRRQERERLDQENREAREKRIEDLTAELLRKLEPFMEAKSETSARSYIEEIEKQANELKMESFGLQMLHVIGTVYYQRGSHYLKSQKMFGFGGMFSKLKETGGMFRDAYDTISTTLDAQSYISTASEMEANLPADKQIEVEQMILGKVLGALWVGSRFEIQGILRAVCDRVLHDKTVPQAVRERRAQGLKLIGGVFKTTQRTKDQQEEMQFFESLVAEANAKKAKKLRKQFAKSEAAKDAARQEAAEAEAGPSAA